MVFSRENIRKSSILIMRVIMCLPGFGLCLPENADTHVRGQAQNCLHDVSL